MPKLTGVELAMRVLKDKPATRFVIMSGYSATWNAETLRRVGICQLLCKPITALDLSRCMRAALDEPRMSHAPKPF